MRTEKAHFHRLIRYVFIVYVLISLYALVGRDFRTTLFQNADSSLQGRDSIAKNNAAPNDNVISSTTWAQTDQKVAALWINSQGESNHIPNTVLSSKVFSESMGNPNILPYHYTARGTFQQNDITICTMVTHDRFPVLARLVMNYKGPVSAAIHVNDDEHKDQVLADLQKTIDSNPLIKQYLDVHLILDNYDRQFNMWRNVAKLYARTGYVMMLDVDFHVCTDFRASIHRNAKAMELLESGKAALVVPAFEFNSQADGEDFRTFPTTKKELLDVVAKDKIDVFHKFWANGHGATNYTRWYSASRPYRVNTYQFSYEPYIIYKKEGSPWCDERFIGYGSNKAACLFEIYISGIDYWVLPQDFLIHQTHHYPEVTRTKERRYNRNVYEYFREEACLRYMRMFKANKQWGQPDSSNARKECAKIPGFKSTAAGLD
ncbi:hypothetical protein NQZ79_g3384 [Umbelopsis isabellina]|nr:hypothetical protein NQZ79_g3384 [Umbelopsis isabellina]